jgi:hypothetical protein
MQKSNLYPSESQEVELTDEVLKRMERFMRKTVPLMEKELE